ALRVDVLARRLRHQREAVVVEPVDQRADRRIVLLLHQRRVVVGAHQHAAGAELLEQALVVDVEAEPFRRGVKVGPVDEESQSLGGIEGHLTCQSFRDLAPPPMTRLSSSRSAEIWPGTIPASKRFWKRTFQASRAPACALTGDRAGGARPPGPIQVSLR